MAEVIIRLKSLRESIRPDRCTDGRGRRERKSRERNTKRLCNSVDRFPAIHVLHLRPQLHVWALDALISRNGGHSLGYRFTTWLPVHRYCTPGPKVILHPYQRSSDSALSYLRRPHSASEWSRISLHCFRRTNNAVDCVAVLRETFRCPHVRERCMT